MNDTIVIFGTHSARIHHGKDGSLFRSPECLINPKIPPGVPPHHWKNVNGQIVEMDSEEKAARDKFWAKEAKTNILLKGVTFSEAQMIQINTVISSRFIRFSLIFAPSVIILSGLTQWLLKWLKILQY